MSKLFEQENNNLNLFEEDQKRSEKQKLPKEKKEVIDPSSLLSKDLLNQINSLEEKDFEEKKQNTTDLMVLDETQKESEGKGEDDDYTLEFDKELDKDIFGFEIFKNDEIEKSNESANRESINKNQGRFSQPIPYSQNNINFNFNQTEESNFPLDIGRLSCDCPQYRNNNENLNGIFNHPIQNTFNLFNNAFTMNGKSGWVCAYCKNFNYESKLYLIILY